MRNVLKSIVLFITVLSLVMFSGCTNWKKKYNALNVEHQNLKGLLDRERAEKGQLAEQYSQSQQMIEDLQRQIAEQKKTPAEASGFDGYDVSFDAAAGTITVTLPDAILFASGKASLKSTTNNKLDQIVSVLKSKYPGKPIDVVGHTDADPIQKSKWQDNWQLSSERALAVARYLMDRGISDDKIRAVGCGPARPVASNATADGKSRNRRVEIVVRMKN